MCAICWNSVCVWCVLKSRVCLLSQERMTFKPPKLHLNFSQTPFDGLFTHTQHLHSLFKTFAFSFIEEMYPLNKNNKHMANQSKIKLWNSSLHIANKLPLHYITIFSYSTWGESMCVFLFPVILQTDLKYRCLGALSLLMNIQNINMNINILKMESYRCTVQLAIVTGTTCLSMPRCV